MKRVVVGIAAVGLMVGAATVGGPETSWSVADSRLTQFQVAGYTASIVNSTVRV